MKAEHETGMDELRRFLSENRTYAEALRPIYDPDEPMWVTPDVAAHVASVQVDTIRQWKARGLVRVDERGLYSLRDVWNWLEQRNGSQVRSNTPIP